MLVNENNFENENEKDFCNLNKIKTKKILWKRNKN